MLNPDTNARKENKEKHFGKKKKKKKIRQLLLLEDGHPPRVGVGLPAPTLDDVAASFGHSPEEVAAESEVGRDHPVLRRDNAAPADGLMDRVPRLERIVEQIGSVLLPQNMKDIVKGVQHVPEKRAQNSVVEQIAGVPAPQIWEPSRLIPQERENRTQEPVVGVPDEEEEIAAVPVPQIMNVSWTLYVFHHRSAC